MSKIIQKHKIHWSDTSFAFSVVIGCVLFLGSLVLNYFMSIYAIERASNAVTDLLLDNLPVINTGFIFIWGALALFVFVLSLVIHEPRRLPFILKSSALFVTTRSLFITLTHIGPFPDRIVMTSNEITRAFTSGADLFFSGHTGFPFLFALIFWDNVRLRVVFLSISFISGAAVLLGHSHYSIDVAAAFFISFGIYHMALHLFRDDYLTFHRGVTMNAV